MVILLLAFFAQAVTSMSLKAPTFDEEFHVARAYAYVRTGDLRMQQNHPPLVSVLAGLPLLLMPELTPPQEISHWDDAFLFDFADHLFWRRPTWRSLRVVSSRCMPSGAICAGPLAGGWAWLAWRWGWRCRPSYRPCS